MPFLFLLPVFGKDQLIGLVLFIYLVVYKGNIFD